MGLLGIEPGLFTSSLGIEPRYSGPKPLMLSVTSRAHDTIWI